MSAATPIERIAAAHAQLAPSLPGGPAWARRRGRALGALVARGLPDRRDENWKYLDHARIAEYPFEAAPGAAADSAALAARELPLPGASRIVLVDGRFQPALSDVAGLQGLELGDLGALMERDPESALALVRQPGEDPDDRYALLAEAFAGGGVLLRVAAGAELAHPVLLVHAATAARPGVHQSRVVVQAGSRSRFTLVEQFIALGDAAAFGNLAAEAILDDGASMTHLRLHQHSAAAAQVETWSVRQGARSRYAQHLLAFGGRLLRTNLRVALEGEAAGCRLDGLFVADGDRQVDLLTQVAHHGTATETVQDYRGIAAGRGRGALNGRITVHPTARGANAGQSSRNLLLSPLAEINARPQLEILVDDVQCRHGATTGTLDPGQLFYLVSRGLDPEAARALLTYAFCQDVIARLPLAPVRAAAESLVAAALPDRELIRGLA
jgi:Fe-S cluster assembly protein SufD